MQLLDYAESLLKKVIIAGYHECVNITLSTDCVRSIIEYDEEDYESLATKPLDIRGYYSYTLPCGGIVTSVEARGFCGRPDNVELRLLSARRAENAFKSLPHVVLVPAQCNKTAPVGDHYEGYVSNTSLNIRVQPGHVLVVFLNPDCDRKCFFQPAVINNASNYDVVFADSHLVWYETNRSLFFSANITGAMPMTKSLKCVNNISLLYTQSYQI